MRLGVIIGLSGSAVLGLAALLVARVWMPAASNAQTAARNAAQAEMQAAAARRTVPVVVASGALAYGTKLNSAQLHVVQLPADLAPQGAFATIEQVMGGKDGAPVVLTPIAAREVLLPSKLSGAGARPTLAAEIGENMRAYTIHVTDVTGVGGHALPGDRVDVVLLRNLADTGSLSGSADSIQGAEQTKHLASEIIVQNVKVLGIDLNADPTSTASRLPTTATLELSVEDTEKLAVATHLGALSLALRRTGAADIQPVRQVYARDVGTLQPQAPASEEHRKAPVRHDPGPAPLIIIDGGHPAALRVVNENGAGA